MSILRNLTCIVLLFSSVMIFQTGTVAFGPKESCMILAPATKQYIITYRIDEGNKRGKAKKTVIFALSQADAKELFRAEYPDAVIISCTEKVK